MLVEQSIGSLQKKYSIGSFELLSKTAPIQAISLLLLGPFVDYFFSGKSIAKYHMSYGAIVSIDNLSIPHSCNPFYVLFPCTISRQRNPLAFPLTVLLLIVQLFILLSCSLAVFCNMSQYLCIGRFSAVSFQVLGHMKTVCVLTLGWLLFDSELTLKNIMGMIIAVIGMVIYSWSVELEKQTNSKSTLPSPKNILTEEEIKLLKEVTHSPQVKGVELGETK